MRLTVDGYEFDFPHAVDAYKFDETDSLSPHYHGVQQLKAVDAMVEFDRCYMWVEIKTYDDLAVFAHEQTCPNCGAVVNHRIWLRRNLVHKYRDTFLYRFCEKKVDKPIIYVCLLNFDLGLLSFFRRELSREIPTGLRNNNRWNRPLLDKLHLFVTDEAGWNRNLNSFGTCRYIGII